MKTENYLQSVQVDIQSHLLENPIYRQSQAGAVNEEQLKRLVIAKFQALEYEATGYGLLVSRFRDPVPAGYFSLVIHRLTETYPYLTRAAAALDLDPGELPRQPVSPPMRHLAEWLAWVGLYAGAGEAALAVRVDFTAWSGLCGALADALRELDAPSEIIDLLDFERKVPEKIIEGSVDVIEHGVRHGEDESLITRSALEVLHVQGAAWKYIKGD